MTPLRLALCLLLLLGAACTGSPPPATTGTPDTFPAPTGTAFAPGTATPTGPLVLRIWLPPQFDPATDKPASQLLQSRLKEFIDRRPGIRLDVRIKALDGPAGLLESLVASSAAAPLSLPDLIALPRPLLEDAALKGLLHPYDGLTQSMDSDDWYDYAQHLARLQNSIFGIPFAGDALVEVHQSPNPPRDLNELLNSEGPLAFPAADPQSLITLALYQAAGGPIKDEQGLPTLDAGILQGVLRFYQQAEAGGLTPFWLTQFQTDEQAWEAFSNGTAKQVITWASRYRAAHPQAASAAPIPTPNGVDFTLATGWVWALASARPERQSISAELADFLSESSFVGPWTEASGYLPPRSGALELWTDSAREPWITLVVQSASLLPSNDVLNSLAPSLEQATLQVLKEQADPLTAAEQAVKRLTNP
jgi:ABC-type glycerol-3-phosphate transport system substrate-binding protein